VLFCYASPTEVSLKNKIIALIALQRLAIIVIMFFPLVLAAAALAGVRLDDPRLAFGLIIVWLLVASDHVINDVVDAERDKMKWPLRPLASGMISKSEGALYSIILAGLAFTIALVVFNWLCAAITFLVVVLGYIYAQYTRDPIGYFTVLLPWWLIPLAAWVAFSPGTILTPVPWLIAAFWAAEAAAEITANEATDKVPHKALLVPLRSFTEMVLYVAAVIIALFIGILIIVYAHVSWLCVVVLAVMTACALTAAKSIGSQQSPETVKKTFMIITISKAISLLSLAVFAWIK
jgi:4-hydroxybenzoate polyprenyltransferase